MWYNEYGKSNHAKEIGIKLIFALQVTFVQKISFKKKYFKY